MTHKMLLEGHRKKSISQERVANQMGRILRKIAGCIDRDFLSVALSSLWRSPLRFWATTPSLGMPPPRVQLVGMGVNLISTGHEVAVGSSQCHRRGKYQSLLSRGSGNTAWVLLCTAKSRPEEEVTA